MGDDLYGLAEVVALTLLADDVLVDTPGGDIVGSRGRYVEEALIVSKIQVGFVPVIGDIAFAVLVGIEGAWVNVDVGVELLYRDAVATCL